MEGGEVFKVETGVSRLDVGLDGGFEVGEISVEAETRESLA